MKFSDPEQIKRLAIYFYYDKDGIVDDYVPYLLNDLRQNLSELLIVVNGVLSVEGRKKLLEITPHLLVRENTGFDVWAHKSGLEYYGWEKLAAFDEVVLLNFTIMGPLYPFKGMFDEMSTRDLDFWGITRHYGVEYDPYNKCKYGYIPMHIQSSFLVIRSSLLQSVEFQRYWDAMPMIRDYAEAICWHEAIFTYEFTQKGFACESYVDTEDLKDYHPYPLMLYPTELIAQRKCPIFKRKTFYNQYEEFLDVSCGQPGYELYQYLAEHTDYPLDYIWDTLLRTANLADIKERMQLNYVLPAGVCLPRKGSRPRVALFLHIYYMDLVAYCKRYAGSMPPYADIYLTTEGEEKKAELEQAFADFGGRKVTVLAVPNRGRDVSALLIGLRDYAGQYDYVCFAHDKKSTQIMPMSIGESFSYQLFENVLGSAAYVENIITTFEDNLRLGLLVPPPPLHGQYAATPGNEWSTNFPLIQLWAKKLNIQVDISQDKPPIAPLGTVFWFRPAALRILFDAGFTYNDFLKEPSGKTDGTLIHAVERLYPFAAQQAGYYTGWVLSDTFARMEITNLNEMLRGYNLFLISRSGHKRYREYLDIIRMIVSPIKPKKSFSSVFLAIRSFFKG